MSLSHCLAAQRLQRQHLAAPATEKEYNQLFQDLSPVPTVYWCCPGDPPRLAFRAGFNDGTYNDSRRARREILKGRFQNGSIAYVDRDDLGLFAALYRKPIQSSSPIQVEILNLMEREGPLTIRLMKELTGIPVKDLTPALHRLQEAFMVFEDQTDSEWDRGWYLFEREFPEIDFYTLNKQEALKTVLLRFARRTVVFDAGMAKSFYKLPVKDIQTALEEMTAENKLNRLDDGYYLSEDAEFIRKPDHMAPSVFALHRNDFWVKCIEDKLKSRFAPLPESREKEKMDLLFYLLIDGEFKGAVTGHFKNGPFVLEDVVLDLPRDEAEARKEEIIEAIYQVNNREKSPLKKFNGRAL